MFAFDCACCRISDRVSIYILLVVQRNALVTVGRKEQLAFVGAFVSNRGGRSLLLLVVPCLFLPFCGDDR